MQASPALLKSMDDSHLIAVARNSEATTALEPELLGRLETLRDCHNDDVYEVAAGCDMSADDLGRVLDLLEMHDLNAKALGELTDALIGSTANTTALLKALADAGLDTPDSLADLLKRHALAEQFCQQFTA